MTIVYSCIQEAINANSLYDSNSEVSVGNTEAAFQASTHVMEGEFRTGSQEHFYFEPHSCLAVPVGEFDEMDIHISTHNLLFAQVDYKNHLSISEPCVGYQMFLFCYLLENEKSNRKSMNIFYQTLEFVSKGNSNSIF